ncbi:MAG: bifunctional (p)ppGpp synthetase/guanosine-3',5'-bis(diphosphate) 3'-pyrophosphohydrolase [Aquificaceae bacterium]|nr:bifunctional (p)ppGpp synthetase/guanosine-3',5'-bis(diphosphate) 3'-pyrophosphohydrolase [Aquificaceae bacterium]MDW8096680.1 bifunctional (p)ppGpp synthetase/guanosine-3',5'-bis(diphosphate) 3'-pyrophosphohydrolase [Aquificaceae bacterium]
MQVVARKEQEERLLKLVEAGKELVKKAIEFIEERHAGQYRKTGEPYVLHPLEVALYLAQLGMDRSTIVAGLLHDVLEDTATTYEELKEHFGEEVAEIVEGVTKLGKIPFKDLQTQKAENYRKLILAFSKDLRVIFVKLADRWHNMKTLHCFSREKQVRIARETLELFVPIANRLGLWRIKTELEDLCFMYLYPKEYEEVKSFVGKTREELESYLKEVFIPSLRRELQKAGLEAHITYRPKHLYSIWQKTIRKGIRLEDVHDLLGVRVIVNMVQECYLVLGVVHSAFKPVPGKFDDYISLPKPNLYQSLHTTVIGPEGKMVEVQIRTWEMHERAEKGIAAHWAYKEGKNLQDSGVYSWLKSLVESVQGSKNSEELLENLRLELFSEEVFVFTPRGDLVVLPKGATPVDFAYHIHTEVGNHCAGAKVNGKIVPLYYRLQNGDQVEILTHPNKKPNPEWLNFVVTSKAKSRIKAVLKELEKNRYLQLGRERLEKLLHRLNLSREALLEKLLEDTKAKTEEELLLLLGSGRLSLERVYSLFKKSHREKPQEKVEDTLQIDGLGSVLHTLAGCCNPLPGEEVYGVITKGKGLVIHSKECPNLNHVRQISPEKVVKVLWDRSKGLHPVRIRLVVKDRVGMLAEVTSAISRTGANITEAKTKSLPSGEALMDFTLQVENYQKFLRVKESLQSLEGVERLQRLMG